MFVRVYFLAVLCYTYITEVLLYLVLHDVHDHDGKAVAYFHLFLNFTLTYAGAQGFGATWPGRERRGLPRR